MFKFRHTRTYASINNILHEASFFSAIQGVKFDYYKDQRLYVKYYYFLHTSCKSKFFRIVNNFE